jgi:hypothetical protein
VCHRADLWNLRTSHTSLREKLTKQLLLKDKKKKKNQKPKKPDQSPQPSGKAETELLLKYQHQDCMLQE